MKWTLKIIFFVYMLHIILLPFNFAFALVVNPMGMNNVERTNNKLRSSFAVLTVEIPGLEGNLNSKLNTALNNPPVIENKTSLGIQGFIPHWMYLNVKGVIDGFSPSTIPTSILLIGTSLIGLIGIARRSFFTT